MKNTTRILKQLSLAIVILLTANQVQAQRTADKMVEFATTLENVVVDSRSGIVIVKEDTKVSAYHADLEKVVWEIGEEEIGSKGGLQKIAEFDPSSIGKDQDEFNMIPDSPYLKVNINGRDLIINTLSGKVVFNSDKDLPDGLVVSEFFLPEMDAFVFMVKKKKENTIQVFDLAKRDFNVIIPAGALKFGLKSLSSEYQSKAESIGENVAVIYNRELYLIDLNTSKLLWNKKEIDRFNISQTGKELIVSTDIGGVMSSKQEMNILKIKDGKQIWDENIEVRNVVAIQDWGDRLLVAHNKGFNMYNFDNGDPVWKKGVKGKNFKQVLPVNGNFLYAFDNKIMLVDKNADDIWKKDIEISDNEEDPVYYLGQSKSGKVLYITGTYGNMVDAESGKKYWKRNIKFNEKKPLVYTYDIESDKYLIFNDKELYSFDPSVDDKPEPLAEIKPDDAKSISSIELFDWGVAVSSQSEVLGIDNQGKALYHKIYKQPGETGRKLANAGLKAGAAYLGVRGSVQRSVANTEVQYVDQNTGEVVSSRYLLSDPSRSELNNKANLNIATGSLASTLSGNFDQRFNAMLENPNYAFIFAKDETDDANLKVLVKVQKSDGKEVDKIIVEGNKPVYAIDDATEAIYYIRGNVLNIYK